MLLHCPTNSININGEWVSKVIKYLGARLDASLTMKDHISVKCKSAMFTLSRLKQVRHYLTKETCKTLVMGWLISHLDLVNSILAGLSEVSPSKLQMVQNMAAKIVCDKGHCDSVNECMYDLHWVPICKKMQHRLLTYIYKCIRGEAPGYCQDLISEYKPGRAGLHSGSTYHQLVVPHMKCQTFVDRSFKVQGPVLWNWLPDHIRRIDTLEDFKRTLKIFLLYIRIQWVTPH